MTDWIVDMFLVMFEPGDDPASKQWRENQLDLSRQKATAQLSSMNAATAQLVTLTSGDLDEVDYTMVDAAVKQM